MNIAVHKDCTAIFIKPYVNYLFFTSFGAFFGISIFCLGNGLPLIKSTFILSNTISLINISFNISTSIFFSIISFIIAFLTTQGAINFTTIMDTTTLIIHVETRKQTLQHFFEQHFLSFLHSQVSLQLQHSFPIKQIHKQETGEIQAEAFVRSAFHLFFLPVTCCL